MMWHVKPNTKSKRGRHGAQACRPIREVAARRQLLAAGYLPKQAMEAPRLNQPPWPPASRFGHPECSKSTGQVQRVFSR